MAEKFTAWDASDYLEDEEDITLYLQACVEGDPGDGALIRAALSDIAKARSMTQLAHASGISRQGLYKALSPDGNPEFATVLKLIRALGFEMKLAPAEEAAKQDFAAQSRGKPAPAEQVLDEVESHVENA